MITHKALEAILDRVDYRGWRFLCREGEGGFLVWVAFEADGESWTGRKWYVSAHVSESEIVQTCLKAVLTAEEHEAREKFLYRGVPLFGPHLNVHALLMIAGDVDVRVPTPGAPTAAVPGPDGDPGPSFAAAIGIIQPNTDNRSLELAGDLIADGVDKVIRRVGGRNGHVAPNGRKHFTWHEGMVGPRPAPESRDG